MLKKISFTLALSGLAQSTLIDLKAAGASGKSVLASTNFDYIVVGGGTAGLTVARRLSGDSSKKVLVLEAGRSGVNDSIVTIPKNSFAFVGTDIDWLYNTSPQTNASNQVVNLSSGKILGGDSAVNGLVWVRGSKEEYDSIESLGSPGWNWDTFYAATKKAEAYKPNALAAPFGYQVTASSLGASGQVDVTFPAFLPLQHQKFIDASVQLNHTHNTDAYSGNNRGVFYSLSSQTTSAVRRTSEFAYLDPVLSRTNLVVLYNGAVVTKLNVTSASYGASSVPVSAVQVRFPDGTVQIAKPKATTGEVILSAGTIRTPQLLELSGVGEPAVLNRFGIPVKVNLPGVGANYEDHTLTILTYELKQGYLSFDALNYDPVLKAQQEALYKKGQGWLTFANGVLNFAPIDKILNSSEIATAKSILSTKPPTIQQDVYNAVKDTVFTVPQVEYLLFNSFSGGTNKAANRSYVSLAVTHLHPLSRGSIHINSTSIDDHPVINPNLLEAEWDKWFLTKATAYARKFFQTPAFQEIFEQKEVFPGPAVQTEADWRNFITNNINTGYHSVGTASLLPKAKGGVVDAHLRVYGTSNLRVVDNSILPILLSAHTQPAAYAIGEIAAQIIRSGN